MRCSFPRGPAWLVRLEDMNPCVTYADNRSQAKWAAIRSLNEAYGFRPFRFPSKTSVKRAPEYDYLGHLRTDRWCDCWSLDYACPPTP